MQASLESMVVGNGNGVTQQFNNISMPENQGWPQAYVQQQQSPSMDQQGSSSNMYLMNMIKPDHGHHTPQRPTLSPSPLMTNNTNMLQQSPHQQHPQSPASVITATYNPTYNRCLPKILSDLDCEMKIKQVLKCIENILLDGNELDQQQSYKLPDRSSSPQAPKKKIKVKEDEELMMMAQAANQNTSANMILSNSNNKVATNASKSPVRINLKVEPSETEKAQRGNNMIFQSLDQHQQATSASPRSQPFDFNMMANRQQAQQNSFPKQPPQQQQQNSPRPFSFDPYSYAGNPAAQQFMQQAYLQQMHPQFFLQQQQQHLQAVQQLQAQQQQMMNNGVHVQPHMQFTLNQAVSAILQQNNNNNNNGSHNPPQNNNTNNNNTNAQTQESNPQQQQQQTQPDTYNVHMEDYHFPVFNATAPQDGAKEEGKKQAQAQAQQGQGQAQGQGQGEDEQLYFFGSSNNPNSSSGLLFPPGTQPPNNGEQGDMPQGEQGKSGLGISSLLLAPGTNGAHMALWGGGLPLNGVPLEEDDKWIYSLLNMETIPHDTNPTNAF